MQTELQTKRRQTRLHEQDDARLATPDPDAIAARLTSSPSRYRVNTTTTPAQMSDRYPLPHAFTKESNPNRDGAADEELATRPLAIRFYAIDDEELRKTHNKSELMRNIVLDHLRGKREEK